MIKKLLNKVVITTACSGAIAFTPVNSARAQFVHNITPDGTLGAESSKVNTVNNSSTITGGATRGGNLFHSFSQFNVGTGGTAFFNNAVNIQNIISRITGSSLSNIDGLIKANGGANLFLINPNGIIFGPNASLQIGGSFVASTANSLNFADGTQFIASASQTNPLLTISIPIGLQFGGPTGSIQVTGQGQNSATTVGPFDPSLGGLRVSPGKNLALVGGNVTLDGGILQAPSGGIELGGLSGAGTVALGTKADGSDNFLNVLNGYNSLTFPSGVARADISIRNASGINVIGTSSGTIAITARNLDIKNGSQINASTFGTGDAGIIGIDATGNVSLDNSSLNSIVNATSTGNGSGIVIQAGSLSLTGGAKIDVSTAGQGNAGIILLGEDKNPIGTVSLTNLSQINASTSGKGNAGIIGITATGNVSLDNSSLFSTVNSNSGSIGKSSGVLITASSLSLTGGAKIDTSTAGQGNAGAIVLGTSVQPIGTVSLTNGSVNASTSGIGNAGNVGIYATGGNVTLDNSQFSSTAQTGATGNAGGFIIQANSVLLKNGSQINASTSGKGNPGPVGITATGNVSLDNSSLFSTVNSNSGSIGKSSGVLITASSLSLTGGAKIDVSTAGQGDAGVLGITATGDVSLDNSSLNSIVNATSTGNGSGILIKAGSLSLTGGAKIDVDTAGQGKAGNILITTTGNVSLDRSSLTSKVESNLGSTDKNSGIVIQASSLSLNSAIIDLSTMGVENAGDISLGTSDTPIGTVSLTNLSQINTSTSGKGNAGLVGIYATGNVSLDNSSLNSKVESTSTGNGSGIVIQAGSLYLTNSAGINVSTAGQGNAGDISLGTSDKPIGTVSLTNGSVNASTSGNGNSGIIGIYATGGNITLDNSQLYSTVQTGATGNAGGFIIQANSVLLKNGSQINASTSGNGNAGIVGITATGDVRLDNSLLASNVYSTAIGKSSGISIKAGSLFLTGGTQIQASTFGTGDAGIVGITATGAITINSSKIFSNVEDPTDPTTGQIIGVATGNGGGIAIQADSVSAKNNSVITSSTFGKGNAGIVGITATGNVSLDNSSVFSTVENTAIGTGKGILINAGSLSLTGGAAINASTFGNGNAGLIWITATGDVSLDKSSILGNIASTTATTTKNNPSGILLHAGSLSLSGAQINFSTTGQGNAGGIFLGTSDKPIGTVLLTNGSVINASTFGNGNAGDVGIYATGNVSLDNSMVASVVGPNSTGTGSGILINAGSLSLTGGAKINASTSSTFGVGTGGIITVDAPNGDISLDGSGTQIITSTSGSGKAGIIAIGLDTQNIGKTRSLSLTGGAELNASTSGQGNAGDILLGSSVSPIGTVSLTNGSVISSNTFGNGNAGLIVITATGNVSLDTNSSVSSTVEATSTGMGLDISIQGSEVSLKSGATINASTASTSATGRGGIIFVDAPNGDISLDGAGTQIATSTTGSGKAGLIEIGQYFQKIGKTRSFSVTNGATVDATTSGGGNADNILVSAGAISLTNGAEINASTSATGNGGGIFVDAPNGAISLDGTGTQLTASTTGSGNAGSIAIGLDTQNIGKTRSLSLTNGAQVQTQTTANGIGGNIKVAATDSVVISSANSGIFANAEKTSTGAAGKITIAPPAGTTGGGNLQLTVQDGGQINVSNQGTAGAGDLTITARSIFLNNNGLLTSQATNGDGGNVILNVDDRIVLRRMSNIIAKAGGTGGNITIDPQFVIAVSSEDSNIDASASAGNGGRVTITAQGILGLEQRSGDTPLSDINVSSTYGTPGIVKINTPTVNPSGGLVKLPTQVVDASTLVARGCTAGANSSQFTITGRGGLPPNPDETLSGDVVWEDNRIPAAITNQQLKPRTPKQQSSLPAALTIVSARNWVFNDKGQVTLIAHSPTATSYNPWVNSTTCPSK